MAASVTSLRNHLATYDFYTGAYSLSALRNWLSMRYAYNSNSLAALHAWAFANLPFTSGGGGGDGDGPSGGPGG
jgi:hypothetical protein